MCNAVHVVPIGDLREHLQVGTYCPCVPCVTYTHGGCVVTHNAYNGREFFEDDPTYSEALHFWQTTINVEQQKL